MRTSAIGAICLALFVARDARASSCTAIAPVFDGGSFSHDTAPVLDYNYGRGVYLVRATELSAAGLVSGTKIGQIGWRFTISAVSGSLFLNVYLQNTSDVTNNKSEDWATAIAGMTLVHGAQTAIPGSAGPWDVSFSGGAPFVYSGGGLYVAFDWSNPTPHPSGVNFEIPCNSTAFPFGFKGAISNSSAPPTVLSSNFRPETRITPACCTTADCDDGLTCTNDVCLRANGCVHVSPQCNDQNTCTVDSCDPATSQCRHDALCDDGNPCTADSCASGVCSHQTLNGSACEDGTACTTGDSCVQGTCTGAPVNCSDGNPCTQDVCNPVTGLCSNPPDSCSDGNPCTTDSCSVAQGCAHNVDPAICNDQNPCTTDTCSPATGCAHAAACDDGNPCTSDGCNQANGACTHASSCDDGVPCTVDTCNPSTGACGHTGDNSLCAPSSNECLVAVCQSTGCGMMPSGHVACHLGGNLCNSPGRCQPDGNCTPIGPPVNCPILGCGSNVCDPTTGQCVFHYYCEDNNACTTDGGCVPSCTNTPVNCDDGQPCTADSCSPATGCAHTPTIGDINSILFFVKSSFQWAQPPGFSSGDSYQALRGDIAALPVGSALSLATEICLGSTTATSQPFPETPAPGAGYWVLVRAVSACGSFSYGWQETNGAPSTERISPTCP